MTPELFSLSDAIALSPNTMANTSLCEDGHPTLAQFLTSDRRFLNQRTQYVGSAGNLNLAPPDKRITVFKPTDKALLDTLYMPSTPELLQTWSQFLFNGTAIVLHALLFKHAYGS